MPTIYTDSTLLSQVFQHLISNALKYTPSYRKPHIHIYASSHTSDLVVIHIADKWYGGIAKAEQEKVFQAFHRAHTCTSLPGTGLGLSIVKYIVEHLSGHIDSQSQEGKDTTFRVSLPVRRPS